MQKNLTITLDERVYEELHNVVGRRRISRFVESQVRPHVIGKDLETAYRQMAQEEAREADCSLGWRIATKALLDPPDFEALLRQTDGQEEVGKLVEKVSPTLKRQVRCLLTALRRVRDGKDLVDSHVSELLSQIGVDAYGAATESLRDELAAPKQRLVDPGIKGISIQVTTFQSSKGLAADYVFITHFDDRYCVRDRKAGISDQDVCSFLVALTRARRRVYLLSTHSAETPTLLSWIDGTRICEVQSPGTGDA